LTEKIEKRGVLKAIQQKDREMMDGELGIIKNIIKYKGNIDRGCLASSQAFYKLSEELG
jgi:hypothetical protein